MKIEQRYEIPLNRRTNFVWPNKETTYLIETKFALAWVINRIDIIAVLDRLSLLQQRSTLLVSIFRMLRGGRRGLYIIVIFEGGWGDNGTPGNTFSSSLFHLKPQRLGHHTTFLHERWKIICFQLGWSIASGLCCVCVVSVRAIVFLFNSSMGNSMKDENKAWRMGRHSITNWEKEKAKKKKRERGREREKEIRRLRPPKLQRKKR